MSEATMAAENWMSELSDSLMLSMLTIPGTHDSATYTLSRDTIGKSYHKDQQLSIADQLNVGGRFLDVRLNKYYNELRCNHAEYYLNLKFDDVIAVCKEFLKEYPSETIMMSVKSEYTAKGDAPVFPTFEQAFDNYISPDAELWYTENKIPTLGEVRGRIVLVRRFDYSKLPMGIEARFANNTSFEYQFRSDPIQTLVVEDFFNPTHIADKKKAINDNLLKANANTDPNNLYWTFTSAYTAAAWTPKGMAAEINPWMISNFGGLKKAGIVTMDFIDADTSKLFWTKNFGRKYQDAGGAKQMVEKHARWHPNLCCLFWGVPQERQPPEERFEIQE